MKSNEDSFILAPIIPCACTFTLADSTTVVNIVAKYSELYDSFPFATRLINAIFFGKSVKFIG